MNAVDRITHYGDTHHPGWMDAFRILLGSIIFFKGIEFSRNIQDLRALIEGADFSLPTIFLSHYIAMFHLAGGILIMLGLVTRWAVAFQIPILAGAVILTGRDSGMFEFYSQFWLALATLALLLVFLVYGSGPFSADRYLEKHPGG